ncbi:MAG: hypothetical protein HOP09_14760 [Hyphomicrobium sp.]|nr:hypothetical protein [Hyphomicrobium sp.]
MILNGTTQSFRFETTTAAQVDYTFDWTDKTSTTLSPGVSEGTVSAATITTGVAAPAAATYRKVGTGRWVNRSTTAAAPVRIIKTVSGTDYHASSLYTIPPGGELVYRAGVGLEVKQPDPATRIGGVAEFIKSGSASEAVGEWYLYAKDGNFPSAWAPGTPGMAGRVVSGAGGGADGGLLIPNPSAGFNYLTGWAITLSLIQAPYLFDILWLQTGIVVATITAQTVNSIAWPARDVNGSTNGDGVRIGILVTTVTTNAGTSVCTISYTNSAGLAGRTGTYTIPASAVVGTVGWFSLQAGDTGVRSVQNVTIATSLLTGAVSLIAARRLIGGAPAVVNVEFESKDKSIKIYNDSCIHLAHRAAATGAAIADGAVYFEQR